MDPAFIPIFVILGIVALPFVLAIPGGFFTVQPRTQVVVLRWGKYKETLTKEGISYVFPIGRALHVVTSSVISVDVPKTTVLEANGSPIEVSGICSYRVREAKKAMLEIVDYHQYATLLATATLKYVAAHYPYESPDPTKPCLRTEHGVVTQHLERELQSVLEPAGLEVLQFRLNDLTYAPEIAQSMLLRQQAVALVQARRTIVEGSAGMVVSAMARMKELGLAEDPELASNLAKNLMLVLCSGERVQTVMPIALREGGA